LSDYRGAIKDYDRAIELNPNFWFAFSNRAMCKSKIKDFDGAIMDYSKAIEINPKDWVAFRDRGMCYIQLNMTDNACLDFSKSGELGFTQAYQLIKDYCIKP
jgi:Flp pilus assembly protein TadD